MSVRSIVIAWSLAVWLLSGAALTAQEKDTVIEGQVKIGMHKLKLDNGTVYQFEVKAKDFQPNVILPGVFLQNTADFIKERNTFRAMFMPNKKGEQAVMILPNVFGTALPDGALDYTLTLKPMKLNETPALKKEDKITADDPRYGQGFRKNRFKAYAFKMTKGNTYIIDMVKTGGNDNKIDPYLILENPTKQIIAQDDDGGGFPNARIMLRAPEDGEYRIIAMGLSDFSGLGDYTLTVRTLKDEK